MLTHPPPLDAVVVGSGPNGLAAAITLARAGRSVQVIEGYPLPGGGTRTLDLTLPGFHSDVCSAIHPLAVASPFFRSLPLNQYGLKWIQPPLALAHPFDEGPPAILTRSLDETTASLGPDAAAFHRLMVPYAARVEALLPDLLGPLPPRHPVLYARFGLFALLPASWLARLLFSGPRARGLFAGIAAHSILPLTRLVSSAFGIVLGMLGLTYGWPIPEGGSQHISASLVAFFESLGGRVETGRWIAGVDDLPPARQIFWDVTPRQLLRLAGPCLPSGYARSLARYRYTAGVFKMDWALDGPIPWKDPQCSQAGTVHLGGTLAEIAASEAAAGSGPPAKRPFVILAQPSLFDPTRAPAGMHTAWAYCHVPNGSAVDMTGPIEAQIERFAPGFRDRILARRAFSPAELEAYDPNNVGGDINGGAQDLWQHFTRPVARLDPYAVPGGSMFLCSASTPPGGGVHGMCGYRAALSALRKDYSR